MEKAAKSRNIKKFFSPDNLYKQLQLYSQKKIKKNKYYEFTKNGYHNSVRQNNI